MKKKEKPISFTIPIDVYDTYIHVVICEADELESWIKKNEPKFLPSIIDHPPGVSQGVMYGHEGFTSSTIWLPPSMEMGTLSHELLHSIFHITVAVGLELADESEEAFTHLMGYCMNTFLTKYADEREKRKKKRKKKK